MHTYTLHTCMCVHVTRYISAGSPVYPIVIGGLKVYNLGKVSTCTCMLALCPGLPMFFNISRTWEGLGMRLMYMYALFLNILGGSAVEE